MYITFNCLWDTLPFLAAATRRFSVVKAQMASDVQSFRVTDVAWRSFRLESARRAGSKSSWKFSGTDQHRLQINQISIRFYQISDFICFTQINCSIVLFCG
jgi:hypothetical protein